MSIRAQREGLTNVRVRVNICLRDPLKCFWLQVLIKPVSG